MQARLAERFDWWLGLIGASGPTAAVRRVGRPSVVGTVWLVKPDRVVGKFVLLVEGLEGVERW